MVKSPLPTAETIDLLVKMLPLRHICMYRVDNIPPQTHSVHLSLYYVMAISRQVIRVSSELTQWHSVNQKSKSTESSLAMCFRSDQQRSFSNPPSSHTAWPVWQVSSRRSSLGKRFDFSSPQRTCCLRVNTTSTRLTSRTARLMSVN